MVLSKQFETTSFAVTNPCSLLSCRVVSLTEWNSVKTHVSIAEHWPFPLTALFFICKSARKRIRTRAPPKTSRVLCGDEWRQEAFQQCLPCAISKHIQIDEAYAEIVTRITKAATQHETFRAPTCRPSKCWKGAHAWNALQQKRLSFRKFRSDRWQLLCAAFMMFRSATRCGVVDFSNVQDAADSFFMSQRVTQWSKACLIRSSNESKALVTVDREALPLPY